MAEGSLGRLSPAGPLLEDPKAVVAVGQAALELRDGWVLDRQPLPDLERSAERGLRCIGPAGPLLEVPEIDVARGQVAGIFGDGRVLSR